MTTPTLTTAEDLRPRLLQLALELTVSPLSPSLRCRAANAAGAVTGAVWPFDTDDRLINLLQDQLFILTHRANLGDGPLTEIARRIRALTDTLAPPPPEADDLDNNSGGDDSPVLTPEEAARYLGLGKLGVTKPAERVRYLVKTKKLRSIQVLGRTAFQRSDLDQYLIRHASSGGK